MYKMEKISILGLKLKVKKKSKIKAQLCIYWKMFFTRLWDEFKLLGKI